jgi:hypothetical protein
MRHEATYHVRLTVGDNVCYLGEYGLPVADANDAYIYSKAGALRTAEALQRLRTASNASAGQFDAVMLTSTGAVRKVRS